MNERYFKCTACGKCCFGWLPLTLDDALTHADRFPLALVWTPVKKGSRSFELVSVLGAIAKLPARKEVAVLVMPTAYMPPSFACPALSAENLCTIHADKPLRCKTMPFYPYRTEDDQAELLLPRKEWLCDTSAAGTPVYSDKKIVDRADFDAERKALEKQAPLMQNYINKMLKLNPQLITMIMKAVQNSASGHFVLPFQTLLRYTPALDAVAFAQKQLRVVEAYATKTEGVPALAEYHKYYNEAAEVYKAYANLKKA